MAFNFTGSGGAGPKKSGGFNFGAQSNVEDPLEGVEYSDELGPDAAKEMSALQAGFKSRAQKEKKRFEQATDSEFWFAVCFKSREEKEAFLKAMKISKRLMGDKYIDGHMWAKMLDVDLDE